MKRTNFIAHSPKMLVGTALILACSFAAAADVDATARERYLQERAACLAGQTRQPQELCLREAGAAYAQARRGQLERVDPDRLAANALARCEFRPADQKEMCERMVRGEGTVSGSVEEGGFVREIRIIVE